MQSDSTAVLFPEVQGARPMNDGIILALRIPEDLAYFDGHFDQIAIVPGVVQIQWAVHYARQYLSVELDFSHMEAVKFKELLLPGQVCELRLCLQKEAHRLEFLYRSETSEFSSGRVYFHDDRV